MTCLPGNWSWASVTSPRTLALCDGIDALEPFVPAVPFVPFVPLVPLVPFVPFCPGMPADLRACWASSCAFLAVLSAFLAVFSVAAVRTFVGAAAAGRAMAVAQTTAQR